jgi:MscS family membrane protein
MEAPVKLKHSERLHLVLKAAAWPAVMLLVCAGLAVAGTMRLLSEPLQRPADVTTAVLGTLAVVLFAYRLIELLVYELSRLAEKDDNRLDETFVQMVRLIARTVVLVVGGIYLVRAVSGRPLSALLAGLGIGGIAVALAAQDTLRNFFGSITIMLDKPFTVGQRVVVDGYDGVVETIGFRSTRLRTLTGNLVTVPNGTMAAASIENVGRRPSIRRLSNITLTYDTPPQKVERALAIIRGILDNHEGLHPDFPPRVHFNEFNDTSLNIMMLYWYFPADYWAFIDLSERINLAIMRAFEAEGIEFAFPTTTTYLAQDNRRPLHIRVGGQRPPSRSGAATIADNGESGP